MNAKHQFKYTYNETDLEDFSPLEVTFEMPAEISLPQMLNNFERYLQACGFVFDGRLDFVEDGYDLSEEEPEGGCMADWDEECGCDTITSLLETSKWEEQFDITKTTHLGDSISTEEYQKQQLKNWNKGIAKLDNEVKKNRWVHGMCNPPSPDYKKQQV